MIITIDGPSGSGKSTVARKVARTLGFLYVNQGAFFRAVGTIATDRGLSLNAAEEVTSLAEQLSFSLSNAADNRTGLLVDGQDCSERLLSDEAGRLASIVAVISPLRDVLLEFQRAEVRGRSAVIEGRDAGTVGFPQAEIKVYLDARPEVRAVRRFGELQDLGAAAKTTVESLAEEMRIRDERDKAREVAPLTIPHGAVVLDTSELTVEEIVEKIVSLAKSASE